MEDNSDGKAQRCSGKWCVVNMSETKAPQVGENSLENQHLEVLLENQGIFLQWPFTLLAFCLKNFVAGLTFMCLLRLSASFMICQARR